MFDIGWTELLLIGIVALIVVGPKDLPIMFRTLGQFTGKARRMAREFQKAMEDAADETGVKEVHKDLKSMTSARKLGLDKLQDAARSFEKWEPGKKPNGASRPAARSSVAKPGDPGSDVTPESKPVTTATAEPAATGAPAAPKLADASSTSRADALGASDPAPTEPRGS